MRNLDIFLVTVMRTRGLKCTDFKVCQSILSILHSIQEIKSFPSFFFQKYEIRGEKNWTILYKFDADWICMQEYHIKNAHTFFKLLFVYSYKIQVSVRRNTYKSFTISFKSLGKATAKGTEFSSSTCLFCTKNMEGCRGVKGFAVTGN